LAASSAAATTEMFLWKMSKSRPVKHQRKSPEKGLDICKSCNKSLEANTFALL